MQRSVKPAGCWLLWMQGDLCWESQEKGCSTAGAVIWLQRQSEVTVHKPKEQWTGKARDPSELRETLSCWEIRWKKGWAKAFNRGTPMKIQPTSGTKLCVCPNSKTGSWSHQIPLPHFRFPYRPGTLLMCASQMAPFLEGRFMWCWGLRGLCPGGHWAGGACPTCTSGTIAPHHWLTRILAFNNIAQQL